MMKFTRGFSLIELMVTLLVASVLLTTAVPNMFNLINQTRINTELTTLMESFTLARHYAVNANSYVSVCGSYNGTQCDNGWEQGIIAFSHENPTAELSDSDADILYHHKIKKTFTTHGNIRKFTYRPSGLLRGKSGSLLYCPKEKTAENLRRIVISRGGRVRVYTTEELKKIKYLSEMSCS